MNNIQERLCISNYLSVHPIRMEATQYKSNYLNVLEYFVRTYTPNDMYAHALLTLYKETLLGSDYLNYDYSEHNIPEKVKSLVRLKFKFFKFYSFRSILLLDCLFICAFNNEVIAAAIVQQLKSIIGPKNLDSISNAVYKNEAITRNLQNISEQILCWKKNALYYNQPTHTILFVANMSAGKSTLINALIGKVVNRSQNLACTAKVHCIINKTYEDGCIAEYDHELKLNADHQTLMDDNTENTSMKIAVGTAFRHMQPYNSKVCFIDTPGVDSSMDTKHENITKTVIEDDAYDKLVYVMNACNLGTTADNSFISYIATHVHNKPIIFVVNQLDQFIDGEDSVSASMEKVKTDIEKHGFTNYKVCPVSAYAGILAKQFLAGELDPKNEFALNGMIRHFNDSAFDLSPYYDKFSATPALPQNPWITAKEEPVLDTIMKCGLFGLEQLIFTADGK